MRKSQKKRIDALLRLIEQAHVQAAKSVRTGKRQDAAAVIEDCQDAAISIGTAIEESEGEDTLTVKYLEKYCETLYSIHEELFTDAEIKIQELTKLLDKAMKQIRTSYNREVRVRKEVVFLPYKASMWDSLESVWRKYNADPAWDAKVVPVPYYDRNPDGSMREYHYEGDQFPKDVPLLHYQEYDLEEIHPDVIYIHNPYDETNYVTSVHPAYYSSKLKEYTDKLVYIPYFVLPEPDLHNQSSIEGVAHFARSPGVFYADEVIVQSENMRRCYIEALVQLAGEDTRKIWEQKIKGTGSPKFDKAADTKKKETELPDEWREKIYRADGSAKKVILYNTGVTALLQESDKMIDKIADTLAFFREKKEDVTLLWRPHPLIKAAISSMRPQLWDAYNRIVEKYLADDIGIYDNSADLYRAIAVADAYYGDGSSVVQLCQSVKMPVMIQNVCVRACENEKKSFWDL